MSTTKDDSDDVGLGILLFLTIVFISLKMSNKIDWSWVWVFAPLWSVAALIVFFYLVALIFGFITRTKLV
ncbi:hypothetical protein KHA90_24930 [Flavobacterium psychroterrae]|uniref:Transmembrane Fragile-X-F protein n=1 Tax=Flavobacterium psychroterrae TaxID=2133767 RepID=A0ABS5PK60_9FLAO|nr:hypothetical protein [Flavobacterium psychroterrae]MBS7234245.1 hypothetical protein [Flavobacterium psychroterrae]